MPTYRGVSSGSETIPITYTQKSNSLLSSNYMSNVYNDMGPRTIEIHHNVHVYQNV